MTAIDRVLAALDAGLQSSDEHGYPDRIDHAALCARCLTAKHVEASEFCQPCRAWLLGDSDEDPSGWYPLTVEDDGRIHSYITSYMDDLARRHGQHMERRLVAELEERQIDLRGYAVHHLDGNPRNNDMANLEVVHVAENIAMPAAYRVAHTIADPERSAVTCDACGAVYACDPQRPEAAANIMRNDGHGRGGLCTLGVALEDSGRRDHDAYLALREDALRRLAEGLEIDPELVRSAGGVYDWAREEGERVAAERHRNWQREAWEHSERIGWEFEAMARRYEERSR